MDITAAIASKSVSVGIVRLYEDCSLRRLERDENLYIQLELSKSKSFVSET